MARSINSAYRLYSIFNDNVGKYNDGQQNIEVWGKIFDIDELDPLKKSYKVLEKLSLLKNETDNSIQLMAKLNLSKDTYTSVFNSIHTVLSPQHLFGIWQIIKQNIRPEILNLLKICYELLPDEEELITPEELKMLKEEIDLFQKNIDEGNYSDALKAFVQEQLSLIKEAIRNYKIQGAKAFNQSYYEAHTSLFKNAPVFKEKESQSVLKNIGSLWNKVLSIYDRVSKTYNMIDSGIKLLGSTSFFDKLNEIVK